MRAPLDIRTLPAAAAAAPPLLAGALIAVLVLISIFGVHPFWPTHSVTLSEAIAADDRARMDRLLKREVPLDQPYTIRAGLLTGSETTLTPLVTAIAAGRLDILELLLERGIRLEGDDGRRAACLAVFREAADIIAFLAQRGFTPDQAFCSTVEKPW